jgi:hypothetical protein
VLIHGISNDCAITNSVMDFSFSTCFIARAGRSASGTTMAALSWGDTFRSGFSTDQGTVFLTAITDATYAFSILGNGSGGERCFKGQSYYSFILCPGNASEPVRYRSWSILGPELPRFPGVTRRTAGQVPQPGFPPGPIQMFAITLGDYIPTVDHSRR